MIVGAKIILNISFAIMNGWVFGNEHKNSIGHRCVALLY